MSVSKVCVQADRDGDPVAVDLVLPSRTRLAELLPGIVELVDAGAPADGVARYWRLQRACGGRLDESTSLHDNDVRDGELLVLDCAATPALGPLRAADPQVVAAAAPSAPGLDRWLPATVVLFATTLAAAALAGAAGSDGAVVYAILCGLAAVATAVMAGATGYSTPACLGVIILAATTGFLVVPSGPAAPNVFLAAAAATSAALVLLRLSGRWAPTVTAAAAFSALVAVATVVAWPAAVIGAVLATSAVALLTLAPRLAMLVAGLDPGHRTDDLVASAAVGHAVLSGVVAGSAAAAASGAVVTALAGHAGAAPFAGLVGAVLLLRGRSHVESVRRTCLVVGGLVACAAATWALLATRPEAQGPVACASVVVALTAMRRPECGATTARMLDRLEYVVLVAVVPAACWVGGAFTALAGLGPS